MEYLIILAEWSVENFPVNNSSLYTFYNTAKIKDADFIYAKPGAIERGLGRIFKEIPYRIKHRCFPTNNAITYWTDEPDRKIISIIAEPVETYFQELDNIEKKAEREIIKGRNPSYKGRTPIIQTTENYIFIYNRILRQMEEPDETAEADSFPSSEPDEPAADSAETAAETPNDSESDAADSIDNLPYSVAKVSEKPLPPEAIDVLKQAYKDFSSIPNRNEKEPPEGWVQYEGEPSPGELGRIRADAKRQPQAQVELKDGGGTYLVGWSDSGYKKRLWVKRTGNHTNQRFFFINPIRNVT